jgi:hypothetical protein
VARLCVSKGIVSALELVQCFTPHPRATNPSFFGTVILLTSTAFSILTASSLSACLHNRHAQWSGWKGWGSKAKAQGWWRVHGPRQNSKHCCCTMPGLLRTVLLVRALRR